jgi:hypothetical protein
MFWWQKLEQQPIEQQQPAGVQADFRTLQIFFKSACKASLPLNSPWQLSTSTRHHHKLSCQQLGG